MLYEVITIERFPVKDLPPILQMQKKRIYALKGEVCEDCTVPEFLV